ncbi:alternate-type signal peptide domain-containing protein [Curtobacterium sp. MCBA15_004]|uniref:alternate-type signal peptide domain-containing protein n=1 Tax=Curtobacterium sp. MCBA15_004 TaxID=1898733 RepID=UPI0008DCAB60|nr:alternate-type signal peptide domain-containing protein [Curtobacterium sp. MCBA15_004]WIA96001.1 alternate-type signal peptide domain-containing protein [Curtobacterium sp. MCBA15_004]
MHKLVTGTIAGAVGVALLLGGAGTFALWNADASTAAARISSGTLSLRTADAGAWTDVTKGRSASIDPAQVLMVPGNTYRFTQTLAIDATGNDLVADLTYAPQSITGDADLLAATTKTLSVTSSSTSISETSPGTFEVRPTSGTATVQVVFTIALPESATTGQGGTLDVGGLAFTLKQRPVTV